MFTLEVKNAITKKIVAKLALNQAVQDELAAGTTLYCRPDAKWFSKYGEDRIEIHAGWSCAKVLQTIVYPVETCSLEYDFVEA